MKYFVILENKTYLPSGGKTDDKIDFTLILCGK